MGSVTQTGTIIFAPIFLPIMESLFSQGKKYIGLILGVVAIGADALMMSPLLVDMARDFRVSVNKIAWVVSLYGLTIAVSAPLIALRFRSLSRTKLMLGGLCLFVVASVGCSLSISYWAFLVCRALCGVSAGIFVPACYAWIGDCVPYDARARVMGLTMAGWSIALILGIPFGAVIAEASGWNYAFLGTALIAIIAAVAVSYLPHAPSRVVSAGTTMALGTAFDKKATILLFINFFNMLSFYGCYTFLGTAARETLGIGSSKFGVAVFCYGLGLLIATLNGSQLDRLGKLCALMLSTAGLIMVFLVLSASLADFTALCACMTIWGVFQGAAQTSSATLMTRCSVETRGVRLALMSSTTYLAVAVGSLVGGLLMNGYGFWAVTLLSLSVAVIVGLLTMILKSDGTVETFS